MKSKKILSKLVFITALAGAFSIGIASNTFASEYNAVPSNLINRAKLINTEIKLGEDERETFTTNDGFKYFVNDDGKTVTIMSYVQSMPDAKNDVVIPEKIGGYTVTTIGVAAFHYCDGLTSVTIPDTVVEIEESAFAGCQELRSITLSKNTSKISNATFQNCFVLEKITIPESVKSIGRHAFSYCRNLKEITLNEGLTSIGEGTFKECKSLKKVELPSTLTEIGMLAFWDCTGLEEINLPANLEIIDQQAFDGCENLKNIVIPGKVEKLILGIFSGCTGLENVTIPKNVTDMSNIFLGSIGTISKTVTITCTSGSVAEDYAKKYNIKYILDDIAPKLKVSCEPSSEDGSKIVATITSNEELQEFEGWTISKDKKSMTKTYDKEPNETVTLKDLLGNETTVTVKMKGDGDMNKDGKITATDLLKMKRKLVGIEELSKEDIKQGDINGDGKISATDLLLLKKIIVGLV